MPRGPAVIATLGVDLKMNPISLPGRFSFYLSVQLISVLLPGVIILTELTLVGVHFTHHPDGDIGYLAGALSQLHNASLVMFAVLGLAGGFVLGYLGREVSFWCVGRVEVLWPTQLEFDWSRIRALIGAELADACLARHPLLRQFDAAPASSGPGRVPRVGGGHRDDLWLQVFLYAKMYLRKFSPSLSVDQVEAEINVLVAIAVPVVLFGVDVAFLAHSVPLRVLAVPVALAICAGTYHSVLRLRRTERSDSIRNLVLDVAMDIAAARYQSAPVSTEE